MKRAFWALGAAVVLPLAGLAGLTAATAQPAPDPALMATLIDRGEDVFAQNCVACHGATGGGSVGPALAGNARLSGLSLIMDQLLRGGTYMPPFANLSDGDIAAVATFIRNSFGNSFGIVTAETVAANR